MSENQPTAAGGSVPDCCGHLAAGPHGCTDCLNSGHVHAPADVAFTAGILTSFAERADRLESERIHHERGARAEYAANVRLAGELEQAEAAVERVRALHQPTTAPIDGQDTDTCDHCLEVWHDAAVTPWDYHWPCPTIAALDGGTEADR